MSPHKGPHGKKEEEMMIYSDKVMDHFNHPRNVGEIEGADAIGQVGNPVCGDIISVRRWSWTMERPSKRP